VLNNPLAEFWRVYSEQGAISGAYVLDPICIESKFLAISDIFRERGTYEKLQVKSTKSKLGLVPAVRLIWPLMRVVI
jgi:hypothetical protein